jgi:hypothetical protein
VTRIGCAADSPRRLPAQALCDKQSQKGRRQWTT